MSVICSGKACRIFTELGDPLGAFLFVWDQRQTRRGALRRHFLNTGHISSGLAVPGLGGAPEDPLSASPPLPTPPAPPGAKNGLACLRTLGPLVCTVLPASTPQPEGTSCSLSWGNPVTGPSGAESPAGLTHRWWRGGGLCCLPLGTEAAGALPLWPSPLRRVPAGPRGRPTASAEEKPPPHPPSSSEPREAR